MLRFDAHKCPKCREEYECKYDTDPCPRCEARGMIASIYRPADGFDGTNRGRSCAGTEVLIITGESVPGAAEVPRLFKANGRPIFELKVRAGRQFLKPLGETRWTMFGGNFAYTSDSRICEHPIPIHDRIEHKEVV